MRSRRTRVLLCKALQASCEVNSRSWPTLLSKLRSTLRTDGRRDMLACTVFRVLSGCAIDEQDWKS